MAAPARTAPAPIRSRLSITCAVSVFVVSLALYVWTLAPTVTFVDSGELIVAARTLGVAHPPGFPLYVLLAHLATLIPLGNVAERVNFASALFAALASSMMTLVVIEAVLTSRLAVSAAGSRKYRKKEKRKAGFLRALPDVTEQGQISMAAACLASGLLLAFSRTLWAYATITEVYTLNTLLILTIFLLLLRWRRGILESKGRRGDGATGRGGEGATEKKGDGATERRGEYQPKSATDYGKTESTATSSPRRPVAPSPTPRFLYAAAFVFGLALGVHHVTVGLMLPALAALVLATEGISFFTSRRLLYAALFAFGGLGIYLYLPLAASSSPVINWGDPRTLERFWWHVTGKQYQTFLSFSLETMFGQFDDFIRLAAREFGPWWLPAVPALALTGLIRAFRRDRALFWFLSLAILADLIYSLGYEIAEDKDSYYLPTFIVMAIAAGFGAEWLITRAVFAPVPAKAARQLTVAVLLLVTVGALLANLPYDNRRRYFIAADYVENIFSTMEPGAMLLTRDWQVYSPMLYVHELEGRRDDAVIIDINQLRRSWYYDYLSRAYPSTIEQARDKVDAFLEDLRHWEHDPDLYQRDLTLNQRINSRFFEMIMEFVTTHFRTGPVYVTLDIAANREGTDSELTKSLAASYQLVPQGLVFQLAAQGEFHQLADPQLVTRGLADGTIKFEDDDVVKLKVLPVYVTMLYNRGRYFAAYGRHEQAIEMFNRALAWDPRFSVAQQAINESLTAIRKTRGKQQ